MVPPDFPRLPHSYRLERAEIRSVSCAISSASASSAPRTTLRAAAALALAAHAGEDRYALEVEDGLVVEGELDRDGANANLDLLGQVGHTRSPDKDHATRLAVYSRHPGGPEQTTPLQLTLDESQNLSLNFDSSLISDCEAEWFLSHVVTAYNSLDGSTDPRPLSSIPLAPASETSQLAEFSRASPPPQVYPEDCTTLPSFFLQAAQLYPDDPALHYASSPESPPSDDLVLSFSQLLHLSRHLAQSLLSSVTSEVIESASDYVVPLCIDKSPEMIISMVAITLAGFGYLALEPSWPEGRKQTILNELRNEGKLAGVAIVQAKDSEDEKWRNWKAQNDEDPSTRLLGAVIAPGSIFRDLEATDLETLEREYPVDQREWKTPRPDGIAYVIYTSGTTGVPKGIEVQHRNVAAFLRNYRDVFGRARGERVLQFPSYSFDVSVMNIWDTFAHGATVCITSPASLFSDLAGSILRLDCTLVDLTPTISSLLFEHLEAQPREGETERQAWERAGFRIKQVNTGGEKVEKAVRERWRERGVRVVIDYGPTETTVGVVSNQSLDPTPADGLPIGRPTGLTRIHILSTSTLTPVPLGCIGEICVTGEQVTQGYVRKQLNDGVFFDLDDGQAKLLGIESERKEDRRLYRTGDLGRWLADGQGNIECLGRKDGQVKVNGLRIEIGEIEEHLSAKTNPAIVRGIVDKFETDNIAPSLVAFLELSPSYLSQQSALSEDASTLVHPFTSSSEFSTLTSTLSKALGEKVPHYMVPRYWLAVSRIPTAGMGKADRKTLRGLAETHDFRGRKGSRRNGNEKKDKVRTQDKYHDAARKAWARVLKLDETEIADDDGFTELGGDSIRFMRIVSVLRSEGWRVGFRQLGEARKLGECARVLRELETSSSSSKPGEAARDEAYRPFSLIAKDLVEPLLDEIATSTDFSLPRSSISDVYPTAPSQDALLAPSFDSPVGHYYAQAIYSVKTDIETSKLEQAIERLVQRHEVLRTIFVLPETLGTTAQVVLSHDDAQVKRATKVERVKVETGRGWDATVSGWLTSDRERYPFKWGQLHVSFALFVDDAGVRKLGWSLHHAMSDGWTLELLTADLRGLCYDLQLPNRPPFSSFVSWWASEKEPPTSTADFWRSQLSNAKPLHWPSQDPLQGEMLATTAAAIFHWTGDLSGLAKRNGITPAIASRLATSLALAHHAGSNDVTLGIVRSGRDIDVDLADTMIGPCVSVLPSRLELEPTSASSADSPSLLDLARAETKADRLARVHQRVTLSDLARICSLPGRADLFDILVTFQSLAELDDDEESVAPWPIRQPPERIHMPTNYTLSFEFTPDKVDPDRLELACYFDARIIKQDQVDQVLGTVAQVLDYLTTAPCTKSNELKLGATRAPKLEKNDKKHDEANEEQRQAVIEGNDLSDDERSRLGPIVDRLKREWAAVLRLEGDDFGQDESFGALGGDSIATMRLAVRLSKAGLSIPTQALAKLPTLVDQAKWLSDKGMLGR